MGGQSDADPHLLSQAAAIQGEGLHFLPVMENLQGNDVYATQAARKKQSAKHGFPAK
jgi:hypothetical protein